MRLLAVILILSSLVSGQVYAQQVARDTGGTCSGHKSACENKCVGLCARSGGVMNCEAAFNICMQTGEWRGRLKHITSVDRR